jgi:prepilin-type N-terminal cleavage/methylation domain-containing protein
MRNGRDGFTLIELLIVVVIIGILASIAIPKFTSTREKAFLASMKSDLRNLATLQDIYHNSSFTYTSDFTALGFIESDGITVTVSEADGTGWAATSAHAGFPGQECALLQGDAAPVGPASVEGQIACTT